MSLKPVYDEKIQTAPPVTATTKTARIIDNRIPIVSAQEDNRIPRRQRAVEEALNPSLKSEAELRYIGEDHQCFELDSVVAFREKYQIKLDGNPWKNFKRLLCGYQDLPFIILQNPTNKHESAFDEMKKCPTLQWISEILREIGVKPDDVVIMDICSLLSDEDLRRMGKDCRSTWDAVEKSYEMVEDIVEYLKPSMVISCQCVTLGQRKRINGRLATTWEPAGNGLARDLCSSQKDITRGSTKYIKIGSYSTLCVFGIHPRRLYFNEDMIPELRGAFKDVFVPCMRWFTMDEKAIEVLVSTGSKKMKGDSLVPMTTEGPVIKKGVGVTVDEVEDETAKLEEELRALKL